MRKRLIEVILLALLLIPLVASGRSAFAYTTTFTNINCSPTTISIGAATGCTITVSPFTPPIFGEVVNVASVSGTGSVASTSCTLDSTGTCAVSVVGNGVGSPTVQASYNGDTNNAPSSGTTFLTITKATSTAHVNCLPSGVSVGSPTTCVATVNGYAPSGAASWSSSGQGLFSPMNSCTLNGQTCSVSYTPTATGSAQVTATYIGDANNLGSSSTFGIIAAQAQSITTVSCLPQTVVLGQLTTCTASVGGYLPTGSVAWTNTGTGAFSSNSCVLSGASLATCQVTFTPQSSATVTATYGGDSNNLGSLGTFQVSAVVNRYVQFTVDNSAPPATITLSGCSVSPTTVAANGTAEMIRSDPGCGPITATLPTSSGSTRYVGPGGANSLAIGSCSSSSCQIFSATIYYQIQNIYQATPANPTAWSSSGVVYVVGSTAGAQDSTVCPIQVVGGAGPALCQGWSDYDRQVSMSDLLLSSSQRWSALQATFTDSKPNNVHNANFFLQFLEGFQYSLLGSASAPSTPFLTYTVYGATNSVQLMTSSAKIWVDSTSAWTAQLLLTGSTSSERWAASMSSGLAGAGQNVTISYYHQYFETFGYSVVGSATGSTGPTAAVSLFGIQAKFLLVNQTSRLSGWADAGAPYNFTNPLPGTSTTARWEAPSVGGTVSSSTSLVPTYYQQYALVLSFTVTGGGQFSPPLLNSTSFALRSANPLTTSPTVYWVDANASWSTNPMLPGSTGSERWTSTGQLSGTAGSTSTLAFVYYHQYFVKAQYQIIGGGSPVSPTFGYVSLGAGAHATLSNLAVPIWIDSGTTWSTPQLLSGSSTVERWIATSSTTGTINGPLSIDPSYQHEYYVTVGVNTVQGGTSLNSTGWYSSGVSVNLTASANENWRFEYWNGTGTGSYNGTSAQQTFSVSGPIVETAVYYPGIVITASQGGSVSYAQSSVSGVVKEGANSTVYLPLGRSLALTATPSSVLQVFQAWSGDISSKTAKTSMVVQGPASIKATFGINVVGIAETVVAAGAVAAVVVALFMTRKRIPRVVRRTPQKKEGWT
jgi:List-Bact-rpt repeat protein